MHPLQDGEKNKGKKEKTTHHLSACQTPGIDCILKGDIYREEKNNTTNKRGQWEEKEKFRYKEAKQTLNY